ncbi:uncharacterized protein BYT42DRAFT_532706 [Radiomyces spectabilis]|uniref:uncharacterized protein n=1 Tax=Radiomyces spectabilis TaxID=64574 RepID=UPI00221F8FBD|nr:uncharacterized protein BYT42DRAFT_532706 [Radiomyces spectabilis]KAI8379734.1 hypothetical protein BYT42DRAFT_532706 [Radiomyces spectabilis]
MSTEQASSSNARMDHGNSSIVENASTDIPAETVENNATAMEVDKDTTGSNWPRVSLRDIPDTDINAESYTVPNLDPVEQRQYMESRLTQAEVDNEHSAGYLLHKEWYDRWRCLDLESDPTKQTDTSAAGRNIGTIDNMPLLEADGVTLKNGLQKDVDYIVLPARLWDCLYQWQGGGGPCMPETDIISDARSSHDTDLVRLKLYIMAPCPSLTLSECPTIAISEQATKKQLKATIVDVLGLPSTAEIRVWVIESEPDVLFPPFVAVEEVKTTQLIDVSNDAITQEVMGLSSGAYVVEIKDSVNGLYPTEKGVMETTVPEAEPISTTPSRRRRSSSSSSISSHTSWSSSSSGRVSREFLNLRASSGTPPFSVPNGPADDASKIKTPMYEKGVCGLSNLGNTCFMNSALQCLSNTPQLTAWFLAGNDKKDLNRDNPLGMQGQVAEAYGNLIAKLWSGHTASVAPRDFKYTIGRFNHAFNGYQQHDSQELLAFLLDGLHEDLNRILKKPYVELPDFVGMPDHEIAQQSWNYHKARNDSVIVDLFQGQFKSKLICNECEKVSVTFDPFMYLSLPLPIQREKKIRITYVPYDPSQQAISMIVTINKDKSVGHLMNEVAKMMEIEDSSTLLPVEIFDHKIYKQFALYEPVSSINKTDNVRVYQLPVSFPQGVVKTKKNGSAFSSTDDEDDTMDDVDNEDRHIIFPVYCSMTDEGYSKSQYFGYPIFLSLPWKAADKVDNVYQLISQHMERYTIMKLFEEVKYTATEEEESSKESTTTANEVTSAPAPAKDDASMDIDEATTPVPIHNPAAVIAAGGREMKAIRNMFTMRVFTERPNYYRSSSEPLLPLSTPYMSASSLPDLAERAAKEAELQREYEKEKEQQLIAPDTESVPSSDEQNTDTMAIAADEEKPEEKENEMMNAQSPEHNDQDKGPQTDDDDEDEVVEDAASVFQSGSTDSGMILPGPFKKSKLVEPPKKKLRRQPRCILRQGEGIIIEWSKTKACQFFGTATHGSGIDDKGFEDVRDIGDPNAKDDVDEEKKKVSLSNCLDEFTKEEQLSEEDLWYCPQCKKHQRARKKFDLWHLPEIVVVHLKRFSHSRTWRDKIDAYIDFPIEGLDLTDRVLGFNPPQDGKEIDQKLIYDLYAVDNHFGGLGGGHYTAYAQNCNDGHWYNFDDSHVSKVTATDAQTNAAYLLFYKRRRAAAPTAANDTVDMEQDAENTPQEEPESSNETPLNND